MAPPDEPRPGGRVRILLVEDDLDQAHLVRFLLEAAGDYEVRLAQDGVKALALVEEEEWDLIVTDLNLPGAAGTAVVEAARGRRPALPIIATTGYTGPEYAQRAMERGADAVLVKPLDRDDLLGRVRNLLREGRPPPRAETPGEDAALPLEPEPEATGAPPRPRARRPPEGGTRFQVLAVAVRPGEAELGCGGALLRHRARGDQVVILHLGAPGAGEGMPALRDAARMAGHHLGVRTFIANVSSAGTDEEEEIRRLAGGAVREVRPDVLFLPSPHHREPLHALVYDAATAVADGVPRVFTYDGGDVTPAFHPEAFLPLTPAFLQRKIEALSLYHAEGHGNPNAELARTAAGYWSRFTGGAPAEALEVVRGDLPWADFLLSTRPEKS